MPNDSSQVQTSNDRRCPDDKSAFFAGGILMHAMLQSTNLALDVEKGYDPSFIVTSRRPHLGHLEM